MISRISSNPAVAQRWVLVLASVASLMVALDALARISKQRIGTWFDVARLWGGVVRRTGSGGAGRPTTGSRSGGALRCA